MVVAAHPRAVAAGCRVLAAGGSAVDAAVAAQMVLAVVEPHASGPGGGTLALHYDVASGALRVYDGLARAPATAGADLRAPGDIAESARCGASRFPQAVTVSARAIGVPGTVPTLYRMHREHGRLAWSELFQEAISAARDGFPMPAYLAATLEEPVLGVARCAWPDIREHYCVDARTPQRAGSRVRNARAARTLERIRDEGVDGYIDALAGGLGRLRGADCTARAEPARIPSLLSRADLDGYQVAVREPLCAQLLGHRVCTAPPPSYGGFVLLRILDFMQRSGAARFPPESLQHVHRHLQASHLAQMRRRAVIGDPAFSPVDIRAHLTPVELARAFARFSPTGVVSLSASVAGQAERDQTSHVSIVDGRGNALAMTTTNNRSFGSHHLAAGFPLNNALANFTSPRALAGGQGVNTLAPGKRPRTAMAPTLVFGAGGRVRLVAGSAGGAAIPDHVAQAVFAVLLHGAGVTEVLRLGHVSGQRVSTRGGVALRAQLEAGTPVAEHRTALESLGYRNVSVERLRSGLSLIRVHDDGRLEGAADPRRDGVAMGR